MPKLMHSTLSLFRSDLNGLFYFKVMSGNIIDSILSVAKLEDIQGYSTMGYKAIMKQVHPDLNKDPRAGEASAKLSKLQKHFTDGSKFMDDSGEYLCNYHWAKYTGMQPVINQGRVMQQGIFAKSTDQLKRYMPYSWDGESKINFLDRALPLTGLTLPQDHVNWITSRLIEFCMLCHNHTSTAHLGLTPDSIFVVPTTHGVSVAGFYHASSIGDRVKTISGKYRQWYPSRVKSEKIAGEYIDLHMVKRIAAYLLGDRSGVGTKLLRTHNKDFVNFLLSSHENSIDCYKRYREIIDKNFPKQFIHLNI